jgi:hypothetical protein
MNLNNLLNQKPKRERVFISFIGLDNPKKFRDEAANSKDAMRQRFSLHSLGHVKKNSRRHPIDVKISEILKNNPKPLLDFAIASLFPTKKDSQLQISIDLGINLQNKHIAPVVTKKEYMPSLEVCGAIRQHQRPADFDCDNSIANAIDLNKLAPQIHQVVLSVIIEFSYISSTKAAELRLLGSIGHGFDTHIANALHERLNLNVLYSTRVLNTLLEDIYNHCCMHGAIKGIFGMIYVRDHELILQSVKPVAIDRSDAVISEEISLDHLNLLKV